MPIVVPSILIQRLAPGAKKVLKSKMKIKGIKIKLGKKGCRDILPV